MGFAPDDPRHAHALDRLRREPVIWLTTVRADGQPQASPVWFTWDERAFLIYSMPTSPKVSNIRANPKVALHLSDDGVGSDIVTLEGIAEIEEGAAGPHEVPAYIGKYEAMVSEMGSNPEEFGGAYSVAIRITPTRVRVAD